MDGKYRLIFFHTILLENNQMNNKSTIENLILSYLISLTNICILFHFFLHYLYIFSETRLFLISKNMHFVLAKTVTTKCQ